MIPSWAPSLYVFSICHNNFGDEGVILICNDAIGSSRLAKVALVSTGCSKTDSCMAIGMAINKCKTLVLMWINQRIQFLCMHIYSGLWEIDLCQESDPKYIVLSRDFSKSQ